VGIA
jgi:hypothetical protein